MFEFCALVKKYLDLCVGGEMLGLMEKVIIRDQGTAAGRTKLSVSKNSLPRCEKN